MPMWFRSSGCRAWVALVTTMVTLVLSGCGSGDFVPPPPPELQGAIGGAAGADAGVRTIELILSGVIDSEEAEIEKSAARVQAGSEQVRLKIPPPDASSGNPGTTAATPKTQAKLIREAVARHPHALIVEPADPADRELAQAIQEGRAAKVPVILLGRPMTVEPDAKVASTAILVAPAPFANSARQLVASAIRNAKNAKLNPEAGAILLINTAADLLLADRVAAIRDALKAAGITAIEEIRFARDSQTGSKLLIARLNAERKPVMVFSVDSQSTTASNEAVSNIVKERPFIQAGYTSEESLSRMVTVGEFAAVAEYLPTRLVRKAVSTAIAVAQGRDVPNRVEIPIVFRDSPAKSGAPGLQESQKALRKTEPD
jgi:ABC-type sugar transport system substrate-binding protein